MPAAAPMVRNQSSPQVLENFEQSSIHIGTTEGLSSCLTSRTSASVGSTSCILPGLPVQGCLPTLQLMPSSWPLRLMSHSAVSSCFISADRAACWSADSLSQKALRATCSTTPAPPSGMGLSEGATSNQSLLLPYWLPVTAQSTTPCIRPW